MLTTSSDGVPVLEPRNLIRRRFIMTFGVAVIIGLIALMLAGRGANERILGSGSTAAQPLVQRLSVDFQDARSGDKDWVPGSSGIDYEAVGSLGGAMRLADPEVDFAVIDYPLSPDMLADLKAVQFPVMMGSISPVYNLGGQTTPALRFSGTTLARIFSGEITKWSDPAIAAENPGATLPDTAITVIHRSDGSGSTFNFSTYLARTNAAWRERFGADTTLNWATGKGVQGSSEMARAVAATPGAIGYLETGQARRAGLSIAAIRNEAGAFVQPTEAGLQSAVRGSVGAGETSPAPSAAPEAYPLATLFYVAMKRQNSSASDNARALRFLSFLLDRGGEAAKSLGYLPLPASEISEIRKLWSRELGLDVPGETAAAN